MTQHKPVHASRYMCFCITSSHSKAKSPAQHVKVGMCKQHMMLLFFLQQPPQHSQRACMHKQRHTGWELIRLPAAPSSVVAHSQACTTCHAVPCCDAQGYDCSALTAHRQVAGCINPGRVFTTQRQQSGRCNTTWEKGPGASMKQRKGR